MEYYSLLGVDKSASTEQIRTAYRDRALQSHPDRGGDSVKWANIQRAYDTLIDPTKRSIYDRDGGGASAGAEKQFASDFAADPTKLKRGMNISKEMEQSKLSHTTNQMSHTAGMEAWLRNNKGLGKMGFYTAEDLLRSRKGGIEATDATSQVAVLSSNGTGRDNVGGGGRAGGCLCTLVGAVHSHFPAAHLPAFPPSTPGAAFAHDDCR